MATETPTKVITGKVRLSYAHIWEPAAVGKDKEKKYSTAILIPKSDKKTIADINKAVATAIEEGKVKTLKGAVIAKLKLPLRDGDEERPDDEAYAGHFFLNASSKTRPGIVNGKIEPILNQDEVYSGCYVRVALNFFAFDNSGNKGIGVGLNNIMKVADGERLSGGSTAEEDFAGLAADTSTEEDENDIL